MGSTFLRLYLLYSNSQSTSVFGFYLHAPFPLLLPGVCDSPVVLRLQRLVVWQLHCGDQVLPEQLERSTW